MNKQSVNTFIKGMNKDLDKSVQPKNSYLDAKNFRIVTSEGSSSGALENIKGNKWANETTPFADQQLVCGSVRLRDYLIIFTTTNIVAAPSGGRSMIYKATVDRVSEEIDTLTVLYDDSLNNSAGTLNFSIANRIKAVSKYETPSIQKVYWTDGYNNIRYADVAKNLTITGDVYTLNNYMAPEMFEFLPLFTSTKPELSNMVSGNLNGGMVQYAYQLYRLNGAETAFSPVSDMIHIVNDSDFLTDTSSYSGDLESLETGKGCEISIINTNTGYERLRLVRFHYSTLNSQPVVNIAAEVEINVLPSTIKILDVGTNVSSLTLDEFNISSTELFKCEDIAIKDNRLFTANIERSEFVVDDWDARAIRFRSYTNPTPPVSGSDTVFSGGMRHGSSGVTFENFAHTNQVLITLPNASTYFSIPAGRTISDITAISTTRTGLAAIDGEWHESDHTAHTYSAVGAACTFTVQSFDSGTDVLEFIVTAVSGVNISAMLYDHMSTAGDGTVTCDIFDIIVSYTYTSPGVPITYEDAKIYDGVTPITINKPADPNVVNDWTTANWDDYVSDCDGINLFNDTQYDGDSSYQFKYQADCTTVGAEGPYVKIDFETEVIYLDTSDSSLTFNAESTDESYRNYASPWMDGKLSWQRDEVYRLFVVFENNRGQRSAPKWIIDLRMPSFHDEYFTNSDGDNVWSDVLSTQPFSAGTVYTYSLRPRILFKSMPDDAVSCQVYRVKRDRHDRSIITQALVVPSIQDPLSNVYYPDLMVNDIVAGEGFIKLVSPEINITKNISKQSNDYLEYVTRFSDSHVTIDTVSNFHRRIHKYVTNTRVPYHAATKTNIVDSLKVTPAPDNETEYMTILDGEYYCNYYKESPYSKGCSGLLVSYEDAGTWLAEGQIVVVVNYKSDVFNSQYNGNTYEARSLNVSIPCSNVINTANTWYSIEGGDTFINYFDISTLLVDLTLDDSSDTLSESVYIPLESSINCDLRHDINSTHLTTTLNPMRQEYLGLHEFVDTAGPGTTTYKYNQEKDLYLYNTVYSQQGSAQYAISEMLDVSNETVFDCLVKASNIKYNGENSDSWTNFNINEEIEVDSNYGEVRAVETVNGKLLYWQEDAFGMLSVNDRSLIQDSSNAQLVLGSGGVLARYDYISDTVGIVYKESIVNSDDAVYWFYDKDTSIYRFSSNLENLSKSKGMWSWFKNNYNSNYTVHGIYDRAYNEVIYTLVDVTEAGYTLAFNEQTDQFTSFYDYTPRMYIDHKDAYLSTKASTSDTIYFHNSYVEPRCLFFDVTYASTIKLLYNDDYPMTKVFDNIFYISNAYDEATDVDQYSTTFDTVRCYDDYQNSDWITLTYPVNIMRRERGWAIAVPRNLIEVSHITSPNIFSPANIDDDATKVWHERIRDKYMVLDLSFDNTSETRFVVPFIGLKYRLSYR